MSSKYFVTLTAVLFSLMLLLPIQSNSQVIESTGTAQEAASQLVYYYNLSTNVTSDIQVTNTNDTTPVTVHVQIFRSFDPDGPGTGAPATICDERDFVDFLTPNDTHVYDLGTPNFPKNTGEAEDTPGESTSIDLTTPRNTEGFVVITPVVSNSDLSAIAFPHMVGSTNSISQFSLNAMGRQAVDLATGERLEDGIPLDGETTGFVQLQPQELIFSFEATTNADIVGLTFTDVYGEPGLQGYRVDPGSSTWTPFIFDWKESVTSCGEREIACYTNVGLHDDIQHYSDFNFGNELLCGGAGTPDHPSFTSGLDIGWTRVFVSGLEEMENQLGLYVFVNPTFDAKWMNTNQ